jgi:hypothetical protein
MNSSAEDFSNKIDLPRRSLRTGSILKRNSDENEKASSLNRGNRGVRINSTANNQIKLLNRLNSKTSVSFANKNDELAAFNVSSRGGSVLNLDSMEAAKSKKRKEKRSSF